MVPVPPESVAQMDLKLGEVADRLTEIRETFKKGGMIREGGELNDLTITEDLHAKSRRLESRKIENMGVQHVTIQEGLTAANRDRCPHCHCAKRNCICD
jgi:hypothetical protein